MSSNIADRERKMDINKLSNEQADELSAQLGKEIGRIMDEANLQCNKILNIYGLCTQINYQLKPVEVKQVAEIVEKKPKAKKQPKKQVKTQSLTQKPKKSAKTQSLAQKS